MKYPLLFIFCVFSTISFSQINPAAVTIARDSFGVPHIYGYTDAEAAYGLAWAHCVNLEPPGCRHCVEI